HLQFEILSGQYQVLAIEAPGGARAEEPGDPLILLVECLVTAHLGGGQVVDDERAGVESGGALRGVAAGLHGDAAPVEDPQPDAGAGDQLLRGAGLGHAGGDERAAGGQGVRGGAGPLAGGAAGGAVAGGTFAGTAGCGSEK